MIDNLKSVLAEVKTYRQKMQEGTVSVLVDKWIAETEQVIIELEVIR